jgi:dipeptidase E
MKLYLSSFRLGNKPEELLRLLDGKKRTAVIGNAQDFLPAEARAASCAQEMERLATLGLELSEVDLRKYFGKSSELREELSKFDLVWVRGGNCFVLRRAFKQSGADEIIAELVKNESVVYGGYSAGIDMLVPSLHGAELVDDPNIVPDGYDAGVIWDSLGLVPYSIAPHYKSDHPESADIDTSITYMVDNHIPFIALRDGEAIVVDGQSQKIAG